MQRFGFGTGVLMAMAAASVAIAEEAAPAGAPETAVLGTSTITVHPQPFLSEVELMTLRAVMTNEQALAIFVGEKGGHSAMAVSPADGFIRDGQPTASALALGGFDDAETAAAEALKGCNERKTGGDDCVIVLTVAPAAP